ncbi:protein enabled homolog [Panthera pardus]|uniref:Protein enabled homolog n=1 Tax=Panthera pardus TaxID=9691 RepID=A0A9W2VVN1_PANPR|nr:protein enabled homolog [Panthera pardus]
MRPAPSLALTFEAATSPGSKAWLRLSLAPGRPARRVPELPVPAFRFAREGDKRFQGTCYSPVVWVSHFATVRSRPGTASPPVSSSSRARGRGTLPATRKGPVSQEATQPPLPLLWLRLCRSFGPLHHPAPSARRGLRAVGVPGCHFFVSCDTSSVTEAPAAWRPGAEEGEASPQRGVTSVSGRLSSAGPPTPRPPDPGPGLGFGECACLPLPVCARARAPIGAGPCARTRLSVCARLCLCVRARLPVRVRAPAPAGGPPPPASVSDPRSLPHPFPSPSRSPAAPHCPPHSSQRGFVLSPPHPFSSTPSSLTSSPPPGLHARLALPAPRSHPSFLGLSPPPPRSIPPARPLARSPHSGPPCSCLSSRPLSPLPLPALLPVLPRLGLLVAALAELSLLLCRCPRSSPSPSALPALRLCLLTPSGLAAPGSLLRSAPSPALPDRLLPPPVFSHAFPSTADSLPSPLSLLLLPQTSFSPPPSPLSASLSGPPPSLSSRSPFLVPLLISCVSPCAFSSLLSSWLPSPAGFHPFSPHPFNLAPSFLLSLSPPRLLPSHWPPFL